MDMDIPGQLDLLKLHLDEKGIMDPDESQELINTIANSGLPSADIQELINDIATVADMPVVTDTAEKVARWRKIITFFMLAGITGITLENIIPGIYYTLYEQISLTIKSLVAAGYNNAVITSIINDPASLIPPIPNRPGMITSLTNGLKSGFFIAAAIVVNCMNMACGLTQNMTELLTIDNIKFTARLAAQLAMPTGISYAIKVLRGDFDSDIADAIDNNVLQNMLGRAEDTVSDIKNTMAAAVAESAIDVDNMKTGIKWNDLVPDRKMEPSTVRTINNQIEKTINEIFSDPIILEQISKEQFLNDMLNIFKSEDKQIEINNFKSKYRFIISPGIFHLLDLLFAPSANPEGTRNALSQPDLMSEYPPSQNLKKTKSIGPIGRQAWPGSTISKYETKSNVKGFDIVVERDRLKKAGLLPQEIVLGTHQPIIQQDNTPVNRFVYDVLIMPMDEARSGNIYTKIQEVFPEPNVQDKIIDFIRRRQKLDFEDIDYARDVNRVSEIVRDAIRSPTKVEMLDKLGGGRYKKSRHYKKRRSTLKRRRVKGRRTRKGKKRRYTKRRR